jgi:hypothetical protein
MLETWTRLFYPCSILIYNLLWNICLKEQDMTYSCDNPITRNGFPSFYILMNMNILAVIFIGV